MQMSCETVRCGEHEAVIVDNIAVQVNATDDGKMELLVVSPKDSRVQHWQGKGPLIDEVDCDDGCYKGDALCALHFPLLDSLPDQPNLKEKWPELPAL
jgi:hypothetical protein